MAEVNAGGQYRVPQRQTYRNLPVTRVPQKRGRQPSSTELLITDQTLLFVLS